jgi:hypothetical protein
VFDIAGFPSGFSITAPTTMRSRISSRRLCVCTLIAMNYELDPSASFALQICAPFALCARRLHAMRPRKELYNLGVKHSFVPKDEAEPAVECAPHPGGKSMRQELAGAAFHKGNWLGGEPDALLSEDAAKGRNGLHETHADLWGEALEVDAQPSESNGRGSPRAQNNARPRVLSGIWISSPSRVKRMRSR